MEKGNGGKRSLLREEFRREEGMKELEGTQGRRWCCILVMRSRRRVVLVWGGCGGGGRCSVMEMAVVEGEGVALWRWGVWCYEGCCVEIMGCGGEWEFMHARTDWGMHE